MRRRGRGRASISLQEMMPEALQPEQLPTLPTTVLSREGTDVDVRPLNTTMRNTLPVPPQAATGGGMQVEAPGAVHDEVEDMQRRGWQALAHQQQLLLQQQQAQLLLQQAQAASTQATPAQPALGVPHAVPVSCITMGTVVVDSANTEKRAASRSPQPLEGTAEERRNAVPDFADGCGDGAAGTPSLDTMGSFEVIINSLFQGVLALDDLVVDLQGAMNAVDLDRTETIAELAMKEATSMGELKIASDLQGLLDTDKIVPLPRLCAYASLWKHDHDGREDVHRLRQRVSAWATSSVSALVTYLAVLPRETRKEWALCETTIIVIYDNDGTEVPHCLEHAANFLALQPHDLCMSKFGQEQWDSRKPRSPKPNMDHTLVQVGGGKNTPQYLTKHSAASRMLELLLRHALESTKWKVDSAQHRQQARWRVWRLAYLLSITMGLYYLEPAMMLKVVKSQAGSGLHAHHVSKPNPTLNIPTPFPLPYPLYMNVGSGSCWSVFMRASRSPTWLCTK